MFVKRKIVTQSNLIEITYCFRDWYINGKRLEEEDINDAVKLEGLLVAYKGVSPVKDDFIEVVASGNRYILRGSDLVCVTVCRCNQNVYKEYWLPIAYNSLSLTSICQMFRGNG